MLWFRACMPSPHAFKMVSRSLATCSGITLVKDWRYSALSSCNIIIQIQHGIEGSSKNDWSRGVGCVRLLPDAKEREVVSRIQHRGTSNFTTSRNTPCCICFTIYLINILPHKSLLSIVSWRSSPVKFAKTFTFWRHLDQQFCLGDLNWLSTK